MFGKKRAPLQGRQRPQMTAERRNAAVFSYSGATRAVRPGGGNIGRDAQAQQQTQGAAAERRTKSDHWLRRRTTTVALVLLGLLLVGSLFLTTTPQFEQVGDARGAIFLRDQTVYRQAAAALLGNSPLNRTKLTINTERIADQLSAQFPELGTVQVALPVFGHQPVVRVEPAVPALLLSTTSGQSYVLDTAGRALVTPAQAPGVSKLGLPIVVDQSGLPIRTGQVALPGATTRFITEVAGQLKAAHLSASSLTLPRGTSELDVRLEGQPYFVKFNVMGDARGEAGSFLAVKQQLERDHKTPGTYIDVRVDGRAYYK
ncbi:MAG TPA: hypothetical protein VF466_00150 [Candidatus Saccharimonadales bacterium]